MGEKPDVVVVATGSAPITPWWASGEGAEVVAVEDVLEGDRVLEGDVLVVDELGFHQATSVAEWLAARGARVQIVSPGMVVGQDLGVTLDMEAWWTRAKAAGIRQRPNTMVTASGADGVTVQNVLTGATSLERVDAIVVAAPPAPLRDLHDELAAAGVEVHLVGDARAPRRAHASVIDGERVGASL